MKDKYFQIHSKVKHYTFDAFQHIANYGDLVKISKFVRHLIEVHIKSKHNQKTPA